MEFTDFISNYGVIGLLFYFSIKEFFAYLKKKNGGKDNNQDIDLAILGTRLKAIEDNHLPHIEKRLDRIEEKIDKILTIKL